MPVPNGPERPGRVMRVMQRLMPRLTPGHVWLYRRLGGRIVNRATGGAPVLIVTTTGRRTGQPRSVMLGHLEDGDDVIVAGTNGGLPDLPSWVLNIEADPDVVVERGRERWAARAEFLEGDARDEAWSRLVDAYPAYEDARRWAGREAPLIRLRPVADGRHDTK